MTVEGVQHDESQVEHDDSRRDESQEHHDPVAFDYARRLYRRAKQTTQTYAPAVVSQALDRVESRVADQLQYINFESPTTAYESAKQAYAPPVVASALDMAQSRIGQVVQTSKAAVNATQAAVHAISDKYSSVLKTTQDNFDTLIPPPEEDEDEDEDEEEEEEKQEVKTQTNEAPSEAVSLRSVSTHVTKRLIKRAQLSLGSSLKMVAPERLAAMVHVDLIAYAENVLDATKDKAKHVIETTRNNEHVTAALAKLEESVSTVKTAIANMSEPVVRPVGEKVSRLSPYASQLRVRIRVAGTKARELTTHSKHYLMTNQIRQMPRDALDTLVHYSVDYIAPLLGAAPPEEEDVAFQDLDGKVSDLLKALRDVLVWDGWQPEDEAQTQQEARGVPRRGATARPKGPAKPKGGSSKPARH
jgi:hypothetical protein